MKINRWSVYKNVKDEYVIVKQEVDQQLSVSPFSYIHAIRDTDDLEPFVELVTDKEIDDIFNN